jgi:hypothetical protein
VLANPLRSTEANLRRALDSRELPDAVAEQFAALCVRRSLWRARHAGQTEPHRDRQRPERLGDRARLWQGVQGLLGQTEQAALRHVKDGQDRAAVGGAAREKEAAWLLARLCELLQRSREQGDSA